MLRLNKHYVNLHTNDVVQIKDMRLDGVVEVYNEQTDMRYEVDEYELLLKYVEMLDLDE